MKFFSFVKKIFKNLFKKKKKIKKISSTKAKTLSTIEERILAHQKLNQLIKKGSAEEISSYALGHIDHFANFCAQKIREDSENLAKKIEFNNEDAHNRVKELIQKMVHVKKIDEFIDLVKTEDIQYLKIATASEMAMILRPFDFPLINKRVLFVFFKNFPQPPYTNLNNEELKEKIELMHHKWMEYYPTIYRYMASIISEEKRRFPYRFFEAEEIILNEYSRFESLDL